MIRQKIVILTILFFAIPVCSMELESAQRCAKPLLNQDAVHNGIQPLISLQDLSRFKRVSKAYQQLCDVEHICPMLGQDKCSMYCKQLPKNYYVCTKALGHFACTNNKAMFQHLWAYHAQERNNEMRDVFGYKTFTLEDQMTMYKRYYKKAKYVRTQIVQYAVDAVYDLQVDRANTLLSGGSLSIFDVIPKHVGVKKIFCDSGELKIVFYQVCQLSNQSRNVDLIKYVCGGTVDKRSFGYIAPHVNVEVMIDLILKDILPVDIVNPSNKKTILHFAAERGFQDVIKMVLDKNIINVNCRDAEGRTPLHYAVIYGNIGAVLTLLNNEDTNVRMKDNHRHKPIYYTTPMKHFLLPDDSDEITTKRTIREYLEEHAKKEIKVSYSSSKNKSKSYQKA